MMPIGPLMIEHRLIERMVALLRGELEEIGRGGSIDAVFIDSAVDFFRTYADRTHHGKEEDILFRDLDGKDLAPEHAEVMEELVREHVYARKTVSALVEAKEAYLLGDGQALDTVSSNLGILIDFYPEHIEKEDKHFFIPCMEYLDQEERDAMLREFYDFDREMIHEKYRKMVEGYSGKRRQAE